ncbi:MAG: hypothetical protein HOW73_28565 [Polyangiaceae bacterium]|nr:hypothetical protein [Polyangiaceae bacterium]
MTIEFPPDIPGTKFRAAFHALREAIVAILDDQLIPITVDIEAAVTTVMGCLPQLERLRPEVVRVLPTHDLAPYDEIGTRALALGHAHALHKAAARPPEPIPDLVAAAGVVRTPLLTDITVLVNRDVLQGEPLKQLRGTTGFMNLASDLLFVATMLRTNWGKVKTKSAIDARELDDAEDLAERLTTAIGLREHAVKARLEATRTRHQAFTLFERGYQEVRRIIAFVRHYEGDAERIAPSIYRGRGGRGKAPKPVSNGASALSAGSDTPTGEGSNTLPEGSQ